ncbi:MAG: 30S ribosomal protein S11 [Candidatus Kerfeldbacteria bacterium]|nr:30S ribosomal protein S11 [Candidatus Kerfeldbacteria bacterium]
MEVRPAEGQAEAPQGSPSTPTTTAKVRGAKKKKFVQHGQAHIHATYNNTIVTLTDDNGNVIGWSSAGKCGFKGPKKATPYAAGIIVRDVIEKTKNVGLKSVDVFVRGVGLGREAAIRALAGAGLTISSIKDLTPVPHNGPRAPKPRRV